MIIMYRVINVTPLFLLMGKSSIKILTTLSVIHVVRVPGVLLRSVLQTYFPSIWNLRNLFHAAHGFFCCCCYCEPTEPHIPLENYAWTGSIKHCFSRCSVCNLLCRTQLVHTIYLMLSFLSFLVSLPFVLPSFPMDEHCILSWERLVSQHFAIWW